MTKLTTSDIATRNKAIVRDFAKGGVTKAALARKYGVDEKTIRRVLLTAGGQALAKGTAEKRAPVTAKKDVKASVKQKAQKAVGGAPKSAKASTTGSAPKVSVTAPTPTASGVKAALEAGKEVAYIITGDSIILTLGDDTEIVDASHQNYKAIQAAIVTGNFKEAYELMNISKAIASFTRGAIVVKDGHLRYGELELKSTLVTRILNMMAEGDTGFERLVKFLELLLDNPSKASVDELWDFMAHLDVEIDENGYIIGWKKVQQKADGLFDSRTGKVPNDVGNLVEMPRSMVNDNRDQTCSQGLHIGAWQYVASFSGDTILKVLVNPADVVSVPSDYNGQKMRAAKYVVVCAVDGRKNPIDTKTHNKPVHVKVGQNGQILDRKEI